MSYLSVSLQYAGQHRRAGRRDRRGDRGGGRGRRRRMRGRFVAVRKVVEARSAIFDLYGRRRRRRGGRKGGRIGGRRGRSAGRVRPGGAAGRCQEERDAHGAEEVNVSRAV